MVFMRTVIGMEGNTMNGGVMESIMSIMKAAATVEGAVIMAAAGEEAAEFILCV